jgi:DNA-directed RNA polymerase specialized sigma24 family protein
MQSMDESEMEEALYGPSGVHGSPSAEYVMLRTWLDRDLVAALASLPEHFRRAVELCDVEGLTYQQTAQSLDCPLGTVMSRLHRGRALLRTALAGSDIGLRPGAPVRTHPQHNEQNGGEDNNEVAKDIVWAAAAQAA